MSCLMSHSSSTRGSGHVVSTSVGVVLGLVAGALLFWASVVFVFYGYCEESCDKPPHAFWPALGAALPFALAGLAVMAGACYLFMRGRQSARPSYVKAVGLAAVSSVAFITGLWLLGVALVALAV
jgi:hypothetical protein